MLFVFTWHCYVEIKLGCRNISSLCCHSATTTSRLCSMVPPNTQHSQQSPLSTQQTQEEAIGHHCVVPLQLDSRGQNETVGIYKGLNCVWTWTQVLYVSVFHSFDSFPQMKHRQKEFLVIFHVSNMSCTHMFNPDKQPQVFWNVDWQWKRSLFPKSHTETLIQLMTSAMNPTSLSQYSEPPVRSASH